MTKLLLALPLLIQACLLPVLGADQSSPPPTPTPPYLATLPAGTSWRLDYTTIAPHPGATAATTAKNLLLIRTADLCEELTTWQDGTVTEEWMLANGLGFFKNPGNADYGFYRVSATSRSPDFPDLDWVDAVHFKRVEPKNGQPCFVYVVDKRPAPVYSTGPLGQATVWVSVSTKVPVAFQDQYSSAVYRYMTSSGVLTLPAACQAIVSSIEESEKQIAGQRMVLPQ